METQRGLIVTPEIKSQRGCQLWRCVSWAAGQVLLITATNWHKSGQQRRLSLHSSIVFNKLFALSCQTASHSTMTFQIIFVIVQKNLYHWIIFLPSSISCLESSWLALVVLSTMFVNPIPKLSSSLSFSAFIGRGTRPDRNRHFPAKIITVITSIKGLAIKRHYSHAHTWTSCNR